MLVKYSISIHANIFSSSTCIYLNAFLEKFVEKQTPTKTSPSLQQRKGPKFWWLTGSSFLHLAILGLVSSWDFLNTGIRDGVESMFCWAINHEIRLFVFDFGVNYSKPKQTKHSTKNNVQVTHWRIWLTFDSSPNCSKGWITWTPIVKRLDSGLRGGRPRTLGTAGVHPARCWKVCGRKGGLEAASNGWRDHQKCPKKMDETLEGWMSKFNFSFCKRISWFTLGAIVTFLQLCICDCCLFDPYKIIFAD